MTLEKFNLSRLTEICSDYSLKLNTVPSVTTSRYSCCQSIVISDVSTAALIEVQAYRKCLDSSICATAWFKDRRTLKAAGDLNPSLPLEGDLLTAPLGRQLLTDLSDNTTLHNESILDYFTSKG